MQDRVQIRDAVSSGKLRIWDWMLSKAVDSSRRANPSPNAACKDCIALNRVFRLGHRRRHARGMAGNVAHFETQMSNLQLLTGSKLNRWARASLDSKANRAAPPWFPHRNIQRMQCYRRDGNDLFGDPCHTCQMIKVGVGQPESGGLPNLPGCSEAIFSPSMPDRSQPLPVCLGRQRCMCWSLLARGPL